ncbi:dihydrolipoyl dehydrogenase [bacterium]|nr:dihydrolipoyl dehydrogenase [bacterium]
MPQKRRLVVLGAGPGGYTSAFLAADLGLAVTLIDREPAPGGVCLHRGCIPSKALLHASQILHDAEQANAIGLEFAKASIDLNRLRSWKEGVVSKMTGGLGNLARQRGIAYVEGHARFLDSGRIEVEKKGGEREIIAFEQCILATGSMPAVLPGSPSGGPCVWDSSDGLNLPCIPGTLLVVGGGYIGLELGTVYAALGTRVTVVEMMPALLSGTDADLVQFFSRQSQSLFAEIILKARISSVEKNGEELRVRIDRQNGISEDRVFEKMLVAIGRIPATRNIGLEKTKVVVDENGFIRVNEQRLTDDPSIFAVGDITGGPLLAHKASHEGRVAALAAAGRKAAFRPACIPGVAYTIPQIAFCGLTESEAKRSGRPVAVVRFPWQASGRSAAMALPGGVTKLVIDPETERILGAGIAGASAGDMISEACLAVELGVKASDLAETIHPHPTLSETLMEAAELFYGTCTHVFRPARIKAE